MVIDEGHHELVGDGLEIEGEDNIRHVPGRVAGADEGAAAVDIGGADAVVESLRKAHVDGPLGGETRLGGDQKIILPTGVVTGGDLVGGV